MREIQFMSEMTLKYCPFCGAQRNKLLPYAESYDKLLDKERIDAKCTRCGKDFIVIISPD